MTVPQNICYSQKCSYRLNKLLKKMVVLILEKKYLAEKAFFIKFWSLKVCFRSMGRAKSAWLYSMCGAKSLLLPYVCEVFICKAGIHYAISPALLLITSHNYPEANTITSSVVSGPIVSLEILPLSNKYVERH